MSRRNFNDVIGMRNSQVQMLFAEDSELGWMDLVRPEDYPTVEIMTKVLCQEPAIGKGSSMDQFESSYFELPPVLDDFGFRSWLQDDYSNQYKDMSNQWNGSRLEIEKSQLEIYKKCLNSFPDSQGCYLYFLVSNETGIERVVYVGKQFSKTTRGGGMRRRFLHHTAVNYNVKTDNYIGDCLNKSNIGRSYLSIRVKSAEMRRRRLSKVQWIDLSVYLKSVTRSEDYDVLQSLLKGIESNMIRAKHQAIWEALGRNEVQDPVNLLSR